MEVKNKVWSIGDMRSVVVFEQNTPTSLTAGLKDSWSTLLTTRGQLKTRGGSRSENSGEIEYRSSFQLIVRYNPLINRTDLRLNIDGRKFMISGIDNMEEGKKKYLRFTINEKIA